MPSSHTRIKAFCRIIHNAGISVNIRTQFGSDINAACGQLAGAYRDDQKQGERTMSAIKIETAKNGGNVKEVMDKALEEYIRKE